MKYRILLFLILSGASSDAAPDGDLLVNRDLTSSNACMYDDVTNLVRVRYYVLDPDYFRHFTLFYKNKSPIIELGTILINSTESSFGIRSRLDDVHDFYDLEYDVTTLELNRFLFASPLNITEFQNNTSRYKYYDFQDFDLDSESDVKTDTLNLITSHSHSHVTDKFRTQASIMNSTSAELTIHTRRDVYTPSDPILHSFSHVFELFQDIHYNVYNCIYSRKGRRLLLMLNTLVSSTVCKCNLFYITISNDVYNCKCDCICNDFDHQYVSEYVSTVSVSVSVSVGTYSFNIVHDNVLHDNDVGFQFGALRDYLTGGAVGAKPTDATSDVSGSDIPPISLPDRFVSNTLQPAGYVSCWGDIFCGSREIRSYYYYYTLIRIRIPDISHKSDTDTVRYVSKRVCATVHPCRYVSVEYMYEHNFFPTYLLRRSRKKIIGN